MALVDHKSGAAAVDPEDHNAVVDAVVTLQAGGGGGGSSPFEIVRVPIAFNTPSLVLTGLSLGYTPAVGDFITQFAVSIETAWNGTTPRLYLYNQGDDPLNSGVYFVGGVNLTGVDGQTTPSWFAPVNVGGNYMARLSSPLMAVVDNNNGGNPGSTAGVGEIIVVILKTDS